MSMTIVIALGGNALGESLAEQMAALSANRRSQLGSGDRSEKIRTYNYPQDRVTDHRVNTTITLRGQALEGHLGKVTEALQAEERRLRLHDMADSQA